MGFGVIIQNGIIITYANLLLQFYDDQSAVRGIYGVIETAIRIIRDSCGAGLELGLILNSSASNHLHTYLQGNLRSHFFFARQHKSQLLMHLFGEMVASLVRCSTPLEERSFPPSLTLNPTPAILQDRRQFFCRIISHDMNKNNIPRQNYCFSPAKLVSRSLELISWACGVWLRVEEEIRCR